MPIDWAATGAMLTGLGTIGSGAAIVAAGFLGRAAVANFRLQKQAEMEIEHAEKALAAAYKLETALSAIRSPMSTGAELAEARTELEATDWFDKLMEQEQRQTVQANVIYQRIRTFHEDFNSAIETLPFLKAYFGPEVDKAMRDIIHCRHSVRVHADAYSENRHNDRAFSEKVESYIWEGALAGEHSDPVAKRVKAGLVTLEIVLLPIIRSTNAQG